MKTQHSRGFTLIELLVVIAIIGILASVVLASLNTARSKGQVAAIKSSINNIRAQAELVYDNANPDSYDAVCGDQTIVNASTAVNNSGGTFGCADSPTAWRASSPLPGVTPAASYCVDSTGKAGETTATIAATATACP